jgi:hypothetical protein
MTVPLDRRERCRCYSVEGYVFERLRAKSITVRLASSATPRTRMPAEQERLDEPDDAGATRDGRAAR